MRKICSNLTIKTPEQRQWRRLGVFINNLEEILHNVLAFLLLTLNKWMLAGSIQYTFAYRQNMGKWESTVSNPEAKLGPLETSKMQSFAKLINDF